MQFNIKRRPQLQGFTLVELLVVFVIVAVLISLLVSFSQTAARRAKTIKCVSNLRSIGLIVLGAAREQGPRFGVRYTGNTGVLWNTMLISEGYATRDTLKSLSCPSIEYASPSGSISGRHYGIYMNDPEGRVERITDKFGNSGNVYSINVRTHSTPTKSIFLADSVTAAGDPTIRIFPPESSFGGGEVSMLAIKAGPTFSFLMVMSSLRVKRASPNSG